MRAELEDYQPPTPHLEKSEGETWVAFMGDALAALGDAVALKHPDHPTVYAAVVAHPGGRRARLWTPHWPQWCEPGLSVEASGQKAALGVAPGEVVELEAALIVPQSEGTTPLWPERVAMSQLDGRRERIALGVEVLDLVAPLARGGINLIIDTREKIDTPLALFGAMGRRVRAQLLDDHGPLHVLDMTGLLDDADTRVVAGATPWEQASALRLAVALAASLRDISPTLNLLTLPALQPFTHTHAPEAVARGVGMSELVDMISEQLVSTEQANHTTLLYLRVSPELGGLSDIIETLDLGAVDAQIIIGPDGTFEPGRSNSRVELDTDDERRRQSALSALAQGSRAAERAAIFGEGELEDEELESIQRAEALRVNLSDALNAAD
ncbi:hypothetical protein FRC98_10120 [Lujinxingia vulgaris]|uniref:Uncharacterized protein n=1 Tax=Lujinxingia vulgaris TaxID=2600176 RepID=A0A5C6X733_9DELT|nr:hypothetical protein [Lujinxingia vulgaris]TXD37084.1 hypothetical protein FRC98_10120 [Lujinxingia vulgaris]